MAKKKVKYNKTSIDQLSNDKPVLYRIETETGNLNYTGVAKRGRVRDHIKEHLGKLAGHPIILLSSIKCAFLIN